MMIGIDIQNVSRVRRLLEATPRARCRTFSPLEILYCESKGVRRWSHYAARFAAKEATMKALGTGYRGNLRFDEISVLPGRLGRPEHRFDGGTREIMEEAGVRESLVSLSCDVEFGCASVILIAGRGRSEARI